MVTAIRSGAGRPIFRDAAHISHVNVSQYRGLFDAVLRAALHAGAEAEKKKD
jgi:hypothetical protein